VLYLFVAEAMACWLRQSPTLGVTLAGRRYVSSHFADDTKVFLASLDAESVAALLAHLTTFEEASGQAVHPGKSKAVPLGTLRADAPGLAGAIPITERAISLGLPVASVEAQPLHVLREGLRGGVRDPAPQPERVSPEWQSRVAKVTTTCRMIGGLGLSAMGRGLAVSGYALSKTLYHAEFDGLPQQIERDLERVLANTVDRTPGIRGLRTALLQGSPKEGAFGMMPVGMHVVARHLRHASFLLRAVLDLEAGEPPPWIGLAAALLRAVCPDLHPAQTLLLAAFADPDHIRQGRLTGLPTQVYLVPEGPVRNMMIALQRVGGLVFHPRDEDAPDLEPHALLRAPVADPAALPVLLDSLVWESQSSRPRLHALGPCTHFTVKAATSMQLTSIQRMRRDAHTAFARQAFALSEPSLPAPIPAAEREARIRTLFREFNRIWKVAWENPYKETFWKLAVNGIPGAGGLGIVHREPCVCGVGLSAAELRAGDSAAHRQHAFWDCPVARAIRQQLELNLPGTLVLPLNVWLLQGPPGGVVRPVVWRTVALAALQAMEKGRRYLWWHANQEALDPAASIRAARGHAVTAFHLALHDFARLPVPPARLGWGLVGADHPFLAVRAGRLVVTARGL